jgi:RNA polymerase sigma factor (TIGR02999 family)
MADDRDEPGEVTALLLRWAKGDSGARDLLIPLVHRELHRIARQYLAGERVNHTLQPTALVNEAYLRLVRVQRVDWQDRTHFLAVAARLMRRILVDAARARKSEKRGGDVLMVAFDDELPVTDETAADVLRVDTALEALAAVDERKCRMIELRFFGGLTIEETAAVLGVSGDTVMRDWRLARAWLLRELARGRG